MRRIVAIIGAVVVWQALMAVPALASPGDIDTWLRIPEPTDVVVDELGNTYILDAATDSISIRECDETTSRVIAQDVASDAITVSKDGKLYFIRTDESSNALELVEWVSGVEAALETFPVPVGNATPHVTGMAVDDRGTVYFGHYIHYKDDSENESWRFIERLTAFDVTTGLISTAYPWDPSTSPPPPGADACHAYTSGIKIYGYVPLIANESACGRNWEGHQGWRGMTVSGDNLYIVRGGDATIDVIDLSRGRMAGCGQVTQTPVTDQSRLAMCPSTAKADSLSWTRRPIRYGASRRVRMRDHGAASPMVNASLGCTRIPSSPSTSRAPTQVMVIQRSSQPLTSRQGYRSMGTATS